ncbi:Hypothetical predicted protein [Pelobates cultripes]|uniref:Uncharacterized protein n=1 Tax=Pelobates cultripes TaxID=61616 RepID=A0AAD1WJD8_PELCU|nr:Hypothetical predicted protein [Pelobates cultripes]
MIVNGGKINCYDALQKRKPEEQPWCQKSLKHKFQDSLRDKERILNRSKKMSFIKPESTGPPLQHSLLSAPFILHMISDCLLLSWLHFYISSLNLHLQSITENHKTADFYSSLFGALQMLGLFTAPLISWLLQTARNSQTGSETSRTRCKSQSSIERLVVVYTLRILAVIGFGVSCLVPSLGLQVLGFVLHVLVRSSMFLVTFSLFNTWFPERHYGALLGIYIFLSSLLTLSQHPLFLLLTGPLNRDPYWIHSAFFASSLSAISVPLTLCIKKRMLSHTPLPSRG